MTKLAERKHSKFSASGAERWFMCSGSVALSEGLPDKDSKWSLEGTEAHGVLEALLRSHLAPSFKRAETMAKAQFALLGKPREMVVYAADAAQFILGTAKEIREAEVLVESRVFLDFIHPEAFGTLDSAIIDYFGTVHVMDFKYGAGHSVSPKENLQMIFYALALAHKFDWNFKRVRLWIIQPRIRGYDGPVFWEIGIMELKDYIKDFEIAIDKVERFPNKYTEGSWCHWCKAKGICPLKREAKLGRVLAAFEKGNNESTEKEKSKKENKEESFAQNFQGFEAGEGDFY